MTAHDTQMAATCAAPTARLERLSLGKNIAIAIAFGDNEIALRDLLDKLVPQLVTRECTFAYQMHQYKQPRCTQNQRNYPPRISNGVPGDEATFLTAFHAIYDPLKTQYGHYRGCNEQGLFVVSRAFSGAALGY